jgi:hypothetical protein
MASFFVEIYRWPNLANSSEISPAQPHQTRYIMLVKDLGRQEHWFKADTLFGLKKEIGTISVGEWEDVEREITKTGYFELSR